jgi:hypothetical protein
MSDREERRRQLEAERGRDELAARDAEEQARARSRRRPDERVTVRIVDETGRDKSTEVESNHE